MALIEPAAHRIIHQLGVYALLTAAIIMPLLAMVLLWHGGVSIALLPVGIADVMVLFAFRKIAPPVFLHSNRSNPLFRRVIFAAALGLALGMAVFAAFHPPVAGHE